jgi:hypothetical protein
VAGAVAISFTDRQARRIEGSSPGDAFCCSTVRLPTVSSRLEHPVRTGGRIVEIASELWAVVAAGSAGAIAAFCTRGNA